MVKRSGILLMSYLKTKPSEILKVNQNNVDTGFSVLEYFFVLALIIYGGSANTFVRTFSLDKPLPFLFILSFSLIIAIRSGVVFSRKIYLLLLGYTIYFVILTIKFSELHPRFFAYLFIQFIITYIAVKAFKLNFFRIYEVLVYYLAIIGLLFWFIQIAAGGDTLYNIFGQIGSIDTFSVVTGGGLNVILYSVQPLSFMTASSLPIPRNCGFAWEPGGFAVYICLAIFINIFLSKSQKKFNKRFWILLLALITTQSTTGYIIFIIIMFFYLYQVNFKIVLVALPLLLGILIFLATLPFMTEKIINLIEETAKAELIVEQSIGSENTRTPQRFSSFLIAIRDFKENPLFGFGGHDEERWFNKINANVAPISGIGNLLAQYGLTGFIFFMVLLMRSSVFISKIYNYKGSLLLFIIVLLITISYSIIFDPVIMSFWMFSFFEYQNNSLNNNSQALHQNIKHE